MKRVPPKNNFSLDSDSDNEEDELWSEYKTLHVLEAEDGEDMETTHPWSRPEVQPVNPHNDDFLMQHVDTTYQVIEKVGSENGKTTELRLWGCTKNGNSAVIRIQDYNPYFFVFLDPSLQNDVNGVFERLEEYMKKLYKTNKRLHVDERYIIEYEELALMSIMGWHALKQAKTAYKVTVALPGHMANARKALEFGNHEVCPMTINSTYEANVPFELRFMVDKGLGGCQWIRLESETFYETPIVSKRVQYDFTTSWKSIQPIPSEELGDIAPMRILSFDIEALKRGKGFPDPKEDSVITICCALEELNTGIVDKLVLTTAPKKDDGCAPVQGARTYVCASEAEMLLAFREYVVQCDPDIYTGYNIDGFDFPFLNERSKQLKVVKKFSDMTRLENRNAYLKTSNFSSKAFGSRESHEWVCEGRFSYDCLVFMLRGQMKKLRSYKLNAVAKVFLGDEKVDVSYDQIPILYDGTDNDRSHLAWYCLKDAILPLDLLRQQMAFVNAVEQGRVTGVPIKWLMSRGQQIKTFSNILRYKDAEQSIPTMSDEQNEDYTAGGAVEEPLRGFYRPRIEKDVDKTLGFGIIGLIGTLDFASLYPSIMVAYNICYCTKTSIKHAFYTLKRSDYWVPPRFTEAVDKAYGYKETDQEVPPHLLHGFCFVKKHIKEGILPKMLRELLTTRKNVKKLMWWEKVAYTLVDSYMKDSTLSDEDERKQKFIQSLRNMSQSELKVKYKEHKVRHAVYDGRQLAIKVVANSIYGFLKANMVTDKDLMGAVTGWGRWMIGVSKEIAESHFTKANGYEADAYVVYGDTDSIMVNFGDVSLQRCKELSEECSAMCTKRFESPNLLEFETIKISSLFINKKRYAAIEVEKIGDNETIEEALKRGKLTLKGLESKRRDNSPIQSKSQAKVIEFILRHLDVKAAEEFTKNTIRDILMDRVDMSRYVITKGLSKTEKAYAKGGTKQQHVELNKRIKKRAKRTGENPYGTGDRIPFVMVKGSKHSKAYERAEDPLYALKNKIPIDKDHYIEKLMYCLLRPFTAVYEPKRCKEIKSNMPEKKIRTFKTVQRLFQGKHTLARVQKSSNTFGIGLFAKVMPKCLSCGVPMNGQGATCHSCAQSGQIPVNLFKYQDQLNEKQAAYKDYWTECQNCIGSHTKEVTCANFNCHNFFRRTKVIMDIEDLEKKLERF